MAVEPFDALLLKANPNPARTGCLDAAKLQELVDHPPPLTDPASIHIRECSPCFARFRELRDSKRARERNSAILRATAVAAVLFLVLGGFALWRNHSSATSAPVISQTEIAQLDFSVDSEERGASDTTAPTPSIKTSTKALNLILPAGTDPGIYDIEIRSAANLSTVVKPIQSAPIHPTPRGLVLSYQISAPPIPAGSYAAAWRLHGTQLWHYGFFVAAS